jgi:hypothetical protein
LLSEANGNEKKKALLLQALRQKLSKAPHGAQRKDIFNELASNDLFNLKANMVREIFSSCHYWIFKKKIH